MGEQGNRLTLEGLAQRLETLERENERMRSENAELRDKVATLEGSGTCRDEVLALRGSDRHRDMEVASGFVRQVSRRALLSKAGAAAVAAVAAGTLLNTREAKALHNEINLLGVNLLDAHYIRAFPEDDGTAVYGRSAGDGVTGESKSPGFSGVYGVHRSAGFEAFGVKGETQEGVGVKGIGKVGVIGESPTLGHAAVYGQHTGSAGVGVAGEGTGTTGAGVLGRTTNGIGVEGRDSRYGGKFAGSRAQLLLEPKGSAGRPTSGKHSKGEIYMDSAGTLFVCTQGGTPGTWRQVSTTAA